MALALLHDDRTNTAGMLTNDGQQVSRVEALRLYTEGSAWFSFDDHHIGSFVAGKCADLAVLNHDYLTAPEQMIRRIESVMTMVGGRVVHTTQPFAPMASADVSENTGSALV